MHTLPQLPYAYNALEPHIDAKTMEIHHAKHHQAYIDKLNAALEPYPELIELPLEDLMKQLSSLPADIITAVQNHGGGHLNHSFFWEILTPEKMEPHGSLLSALIETFGSFDEFKTQFTQSALSRFGSGWAWLLVDNGVLTIESTPNQDTPVSQEKTPILGLDIWEHAYYLTYQNKRADYIEHFFNIINWDKAQNIYEATI